MPSDAKDLKLAESHSLRPLNPNNQPDARERAALTAFEQGASELACYAKQGYQVGDVRGGTSVSFRMSEVQTKLQRNSLIILGLAPSPGSAW